MGVAREVGEHGLWPGEGRLGEDAPLRPAQRRKRGVEGVLVGKGREIAAEGEAAGCMQGDEAFRPRNVEQGRYSS